MPAYYIMFAASLLEDIATSIAWHSGAYIYYIVVVQHYAIDDCYVIGVRLVLPLTRGFIIIGEPSAERHIVGQQAHAAIVKATR